MARRKWILLAVVLAASAGGAAVGTGVSAANSILGHSCSPSPNDCVGWFTSDVTVTWFTNPPGACGSGSVTTDTSGTKLYCTVDDPPGSITASVTIKLDKTPPTVTGAAPDRPPDSAGWYNHAVKVNFAGSDATSSIASCSSVPFAGLDSGDASVGGTCRDVAGNMSAPSVLNLRYDASPPLVLSATPARPPDHDGWYNHPVAFSFVGTDATSGIASCDNATYGGLAGADASVVGTCRDVAGDSTSRWFPLRYKATPPSLQAVRASAQDGAVLLSWRASSDTQSVTVTRSPGVAGTSPTRIYSGGGNGLRDVRVKNGRLYRYTVTAVDAAGNSVVRAVQAMPPGRLLSPAVDARLRAPPRLAWRRFAGARYYNVQLWRLIAHRWRKVMTQWPTAAHLQLGHSWRFRGRRYTLVPGSYRWYVWPGEGSLAARRFGPLLGVSWFTMVR